MSGSAPSVDGLFTARLPKALSELTERVVRGTWLWPSEKRDVRLELESHFREGLYELTQEGRSLDESIALLRDEFGDPDIAAKLIRRGKKRGRPMLWKVTISIVLACVVVLGAGAGYVAYVTFASPTPTVDYIAKINEPTQRVAEQDRAWPLLQEILFEMLPTLETLPKPKTPEWAQTPPSVAAARAFVPRIVAAVSKPSFGYVYGKEGTEYLKRRDSILHRSSQSALEPDPLVPPTLGMVLPHLSDLRSLANFLVLTARERSAAGDFQGAWQSLDASHRLGVHLLGGRTLIEQLVGSAAITRATEQMRTMLYEWRDRLSPQDLATARASHVMTASIEPFKPTLKGEEFFFEDVVQYVFTDDGSGNGRLIPTQFTKIVSMGNEPGQIKETQSDAYAITVAALHADRRETLAKHHEVLDRAIEYWSLPLYDPRRADGNALVEKMSQEAIESKRFALIGLMLPALSRADELIRETAQSELATRTIIGLLSYRADNQAMPTRLAEIAPRYLCEVPTDIYSGMFLKYFRGEDGQVTLYSVGRNFKDDGGSREKIIDTAHGGQEISADQVFWPVE